MLPKKQGKYRFNDFEIDLARRTFRREGNRVLISPRTFDLLVFFLQNPARDVSKDELIQALWPNSSVEESNLSQHIYLLRKAISGQESGDKLLISVPGIGYQFTAPVTEELPSPLADPGDRTLQPSPPQPTRQPSEEASASAQPEPGTPRFAYFEHEEEAKRRARSLPPGLFRIILLAAGSLTVLALLSVAGWMTWQRLHTSQGGSVGLVIADFDNSTGNAQFDQSLRTALTMDLQQSPYLRIASPTEVRQKLDEIKSSPAQYAAPAQDIPRTVCSALGDQAYITSEIHPFLKKLMLSVQAYDCKSGKKRASSRGIADTPEAVLAILDKVAADIRSQLGESSASISHASKSIFPANTGSLAALKAYADASQLGLAGNYTDSIPLFEQAIQLAPQFTHAYENLGMSYSNLGERDAATAKLTKAYQLRDSVDDYSRLNIVANYHQLVTGDLLASIRNDKEWREEYPHDPSPLISLADLEIQIGKSAMAPETARQAIELNPSSAAAYEVLARAQMHLGQFEEAASTCRQAITHHVDTAQIHGILLQIAFKSLDQAGQDEQLAWAPKSGDGTPDPTYMQVQRGWIDFAEGRAKAAQTIFTNLADGYRQANKPELVNSLLSKLPRIQAELGLVDTARAELSRLPSDSPATNNADLAVAVAHVGETARAQTLLERELGAHPAATLWPEYYATQIRAASCLNQHDPNAAIQALQPAVQFDLRGFDTPALRGRAFLAAGQPAQAEAEFHKILDHPGLEPFSHNYALAQLGLARSLAQQDKIPEASFAYKLLFEIWKDADPDLPRLKEAKAEYVKLTGASSKTVRVTPSSLGLSKPAPVKSSSSRAAGGKPSAAAAKPRHK